MGVRSPCQRCNLTGDGDQYDMGAGVNTLIMLESNGKAIRIIHGAITIDRQAGMGPGKNLRAIIEESLLEEWEPCFDNNAKSIFKPVSIETPSVQTFSMPSPSIGFHEFRIPSQSCFPLTSRLSRTLCI
ncbi:SAGA complex subunit spt3 [Fusarium oxysporum f. sp. albedinis]|nr:SAGA complex subunit spt3 [Fusarium oxysporum f. sp. albedinis]